MSDGADGRRVILLLFLALALATAFALLWFAQEAPPEARPRVYVALAIDLALPLVAWFVFRRMPRNRHVVE